MNDTSSFFIKDKALFGSYPTQEIVDDFISKGVKYFIDLTNNFEQNKLKSYTIPNNCIYINFQIKDRSVPQNLFHYSKFIVKLSNIINNLQNNEKIYIHCRGGHGRAGIVVSCLLCYIYKYKSQEALLLTNKYHNERKIMNDKWRVIGSPQTEYQKKFVIRLFKPIFLNNIYNKNTYYYLNNNSKHEIEYENYTYKNINLCYHTIKFPILKKKLCQAITFYEFKNILAENNFINDNFSKEKYY